MKRSLSGWILSCILSTATVVSGQIATTSLRGTIKDPTGAVVPGVRVTLLNKATGKMLSSVSSNTGFYELEQIPPATYTISVSAEGFGNQSKIAELLVDQPATVDFTLRVQSSTVTVDVSAEAQTLNTTDASLGNSADNAEIQALPSETRNVPDLLSLQPGVLFLGQMNTNTDSRQGVVNGGRSDQGNITLDGVDDNDEVNGYAFTGVLRETQDSVEEFRVITGDANADQGRSSGAQVSMVTKSGTNKFHGAAYEYNRPTFTVANDWFNKQAELGSGLPNIPGKLIRNIFGADVGGPIKKDKLFFFGNYEGSRLAENAEVVQTDPTASYQKGILMYQDASGNNQALNPAQVAVLDAACKVCNTAAYPHPPGPNPNALSYFNSMPAANGTEQGDTINEGSYAFSSPNPIRLNTTIGRIDYVPSDKHRIFARGNLQKDVTDNTEQFPGQGPSSTVEDNTKGVTGGETWTITPHIINDIRYGYIRQGFSNRGVGAGDYVDFRFLTSPTAETRTTITTVPVNNIVDNLSWNKGKHTFQFGGNWRLIHQNFNTDQDSFNNGSTNPYWLGGLAPSPSNLGGGFGNSYLIAYANLVGAVPSVTDVYDYHVSSASSATLLADGVPLVKQFKANEYEWYAQDAWHALPNLTVTLGVRHSILQTPWETNGQEITPTIDTHTWYLQRESAALGGQIYEPNLAFTPSGPFYNKPGYYPKSKDNFAPRLAIAYSPDSKTSIRAGAGLYYDHFGESLVNNFAQNGQFGISSQITNPASIYQTETAPRFVSRNTLPFNNGVGASTESYPYTPGEYNALITTGLDSRMKTPYSETLDLSIQREIPGGFTVEAAYVGRMGRHLLQSIDLAEPTDFVDPGGGSDYYSAGTALSKLVDAHGGFVTPTSAGGPPNVGPGCNCYEFAQVPSMKYFENMFYWLKNFDYPGESATQAIYSDEWSPSRANLGATTALIDLDLYCGTAYQNPYSNAYNPYPCPSTFVSRFWQYQFASLFSLSSIGMSYYNSGQITLRHPMSHGLSADVSYTFSNSIDEGSDAERSPALSFFNFSIIYNTWKPQLNRAHSDFDTRHLITGDYVYQLPFGQGKAVLGNVNRWGDAAVGGWQLSGIVRNASALPWTMFEPGYTTNWTYGSDAVVTAPFKLHRQFNSAGDPAWFSTAVQNQINQGVYSGSPIRLPYPGEAGERNFFRGDGYFDLDSGLAKVWKFGEFGALKFAWEVYNVTNTVRFDPASIGGDLTGGNLGVADKLLSSPRRMQFSLRYDF
ncbi:MAG: TonB-dependent receptor [Terracidiphilus sp.]